MYCFVCVVYPCTFEHWPRKFQFVFGMIGCIVCGLLIGPSSLFNVEYTNYWITIIGAIILGIFLGIIYVTCVPEMLERM